MGDLVVYEVRLCCAVTRGGVELFAMYAGIASGRMLVVGAPAAGKSGTAVLLVLDALEHRSVWRTRTGPSCRYQCC